MPLTDLNPAIALRAEIECLSLPGFLRWDTSQEALLVSDAPRHAGYIRPVLPNNRVWEQRGLLRIDLSEKAYADLLCFDFWKNGAWLEDWFTEQAFLAAILSVVADAKPTQPDERLLRRAALACAQGEPQVRQFLSALPAIHAEALRLHSTASCRACAALCAQWLWREKGIGLPAIRKICVETSD